MERERIKMRLRLFVVCPSPSYFECVLRVVNFKFIFVLMKYLLTNSAGSNFKTKTLLLFLPKPKA